MGFKVVWVGIVAIICSACVSAPKGPYWTDQQWVNSLQRSLHLTYPGPNVYSGLKSVHATVAFTYNRGRAENVRIIDTTGSGILDNSIESEVLHASLPPAYGIEKLAPHDFQFNVSLQPPFTNFATILRQDIVDQTTPSLRKYSPGDYGYVVIGFDYQDGSLSNVKVLYDSSGERKLADDIAAHVLRVKVPAPIPAVAGKRMKFRIGFCLMSNYLECNHLEQKAYKLIQ